MVVLNGDQFGFAIFKPLLCFRSATLRAVPVAARVVRDPLVIARHAVQHMTAERLSSALLDSRHDLQLAKTEMATMHPAIHIAMRVQDVGHL